MPKLESEQTLIFNDIIFADIPPTSISIQESNNVTVKPVLNTSPEIIDTGSSRTIISIVLTLGNISTGDFYNKYTKLVQETASMPFAFIQNNYLQKTLSNINQGSINYITVGIDNVEFNFANNICNVKLTCTYVPVELMFHTTSTLVFKRKDNDKSTVDPYYIDYSIFYGNKFNSLETTTDKIYLALPRLITNVNVKSEINSNAEAQNILISLKDKKSKLETIKANNVKILKVIDGDTLKIKYNGIVFNTRLSGVNAPDKYDDKKLYNLAKEFTKNFIFEPDGKTLKKDFELYFFKDEYDKSTPFQFRTGSYGRPLVKILVNGKSLSNEILQAGLAWIAVTGNEDTETSNVGELLNIQNQAIENYGKVEYESFEEFKQRYLDEYNFNNDIRVKEINKKIDAEKYSSQHWSSYNMSNLSELEKEREEIINNILKELYDLAKENGNLKTKFTPGKIDNKNTIWNSYFNVHNKDMYKRMIYDQTVAYYMNVLHDRVGIFASDFKLTISHNNIYQNLRGAEHPTIQNVAAPAIMASFSLAVPNDESSFGTPLSNITNGLNEYKKVLNRSDIVKAKRMPAYLYSNILNSVGLKTCFPLSIAHSTTNNPGVRTVNFSLLFDTKGFGKDPFLKFEESKFRKSNSIFYMLDKIKDICKDEYSHWDNELIHQIFLDTLSMIKDNVKISATDITVKGIASAVPIYGNIMSSFMGATRGTDDISKEVLSILNEYKINTIFNSPLITKIQLSDAYGVLSLFVKYSSVEYSGTFDYKVQDSMDSAALALLKVLAKYNPNNNIVQKILNSNIEWSNNVNGPLLKHTLFKNNKYNVDDILLINSTKDLVVNVKNIFKNNFQEFKQSILSTTTQFDIKTAAKKRSNEIDNNILIEILEASPSPGMLKTANLASNETVIVKQRREENAKGSTSGVKSKNKKSPENHRYNNFEYSMAFDDNLSYACKYLELGFKKVFPSFKLYFREKNVVYLEDTEIVAPWSDFDSYFSSDKILGISLHQSDDSPADVLTIYIYNSARGELSKIPKKNMETIAENKTIASTEDIPFNIPFEEGTEIQLYLGYGNNPNDLTLKFNGTIMSVSIAAEPEISKSGAIATIVCQSFGAELLNILQDYEPGEDLCTENRSVFDWRGESVYAVAYSLLATNNCLHFGWYKNIFKKELLANAGRGISNNDGYTPNGIDEWIPLEAPFNDNIFIPKKIIPQWLRGDDDTYTTYYYMGETIWDVYRTIASIFPNYITQVLPYEDRVTLYFGPKSGKYYTRDATPTEWLKEYGVKTTNNENIKNKKYPKMFEHLQKTYYAISGVNIISNTILATNKNIANTAITTLEVGYKNGKEIKAALKSGVMKFEKADVKLHAAPYLSSEQQREKYFLNVNLQTERAAYVFLQNSLADEFRNTYKGNLILLGNPDIKPNDIIMMQDNYNDMYGVFEVKKITHIVDAEMGFISVIEPKMKVDVNEKMSADVAADLNYSTGLLGSIFNLRSLKHIFTAYTNLSTYTYLEGKEQEIVRKQVLDIGLSTIAAYFTDKRNFFDYYSSATLQFPTLNQCIYPFYATPLIFKDRPMIFGLGDNKNLTFIKNYQEEHLKGLTDATLMNKLKGIDEKKNFWNFYLQKLLIGSPIQLNYKQSK